MKKNSLFLGLMMVLIGVFSVTGCGGNQQNKQNGEAAGAEMVSITHSLGTIKVVSNPQRVVVLDFSALENLDYLGIKPVGVPKTGLPTHLSKYKNDPSIVDVGSITEVNLERVNEARPDLIIIGQRLIEFYDQLSAIAPVLNPAAVDAGNFMDAFESNLDDLALLFDKKDEVEKAKAEIQAKVEGLKRVTSGAEEKALILLHNRGRFSAYGSGSRFGLVHDVLGVAEAAEGLGTHRHGNPVSSEFIQKTNPDIIFIVDRSQVVDKEITDKEEIENRLIKQTHAAVNNKIFYLNPEMWYLAGGGITSVKVMIDEVAQVF